MATRDPRNPYPDDPVAPDASTNSPAEASGSGVAVVDKAAEQVSALRRALTIQPDDSKLVGFAKIFGMGLLAIVLLALSPLILVGLLVGLAAAA